MPRRKSKSSKKGLYAIIILVIVAAVGFVAWHDGMIGTTSIQDINNGDIDVGTTVTIRGEVTFVVSLPIIGTRITIADLNDDSYGLIFEWDGDIPAVGSIVAVTGEVSSFVSLDDVTSVQVVWAFKG